MSNPRCTELVLDISANNAVNNSVLLTENTANKVSLRSISTDGNETINIISPQDLMVEIIVYSTATCPETHSTYKNKEILFHNLNNDVDKVFHRQFPFHHSDRKLQITVNMNESNQPDFSYTKSLMKNINNFGHHLCASAVSNRVTLTCALFSIIIVVCLTRWGFIVTTTGLTKVSLVEDQQTKCRNGIFELIKCTEHHNTNFVDSPCNSCKNNQYWGRQCENQCSVYCTDGQCDKDTGQCHSCKVGYFGAECNFQCPAECKGQKCDQLTGTCIGCAHDTQWGEMCEKDCPIHCTNSKCEQNTGACLSCEQNLYWGSHCDQLCSPNCSDH